MPISKKRKKNNRTKNVNLPKTISINKQIDNIQKDFRLKLINNYLDFIDKEFIKTKKNAEEAFFENFKVYRKTFKEKVINIYTKKNYITKTEFDNLFNFYIITTLNDLSKFIEAFSIASLSYISNELKPQMQNIFNNYYFICLNEKKSRELLKRTIINSYESTEEYGIIYCDEFDIFSRQLISNNFHLFLTDIAVFFKSKELNYDLTDIIHELNEPIDIKYLEKYRELNKLAIKNGFSHIRDNGDHGIFINEKSKQIVVIPQGRQIGKGLSLKIQSQILGNKKAKSQNYTPSENKFPLNSINIKKEFNSITKENDMDKLINFIDTHQEIFKPTPELSQELLKVKEHQIMKKVQKYIETNQFDLTLKILLDFINHNPNATTVISLIASTYEDKGDIDNAIKYYKKYIDKNGEIYLAYDKLINLLEDLERYEEAEYYEMIKNGKFLDKNTLFEDIKKSISEKNLNLTDTLIKKFNDIPPYYKSANDYYEIAISYLNIDKYDVVRLYCNKTLELDPEHQGAKSLLTALILLEN